ncbi:MAG: multidrug transporter [Proteobacteria bacterium]|nr:multidrug transporter [Pseudomonadota bacterium]
MRHVAVMTMTSMVGLTFLFMVDAAAIFWVSFLDDEMLMAALGFAWTIQFFTISTSIGFMIAGSAMVAKSLGQGNRGNAREQATSAMMIGVGIQAVTVIMILIFRRDILAFAGAEGEVLEIASRFLLISVPSLLLIVIGMMASAILRAEGDAKRGLYVTLSAGSVAMIIDPVLILWMGMGVEGAAWGVVISRSVSAALGLYFVIRVHDLVAPVRLTFVRRWGGPFFIIAAPAIMTQLSSPFGNYLITRIISDFGESAVAGWAVLSRITVLAFGGIFALSGAIGGIIGQNYGAHKFDRVRTAYRDALLFCAGYVMVAWAILALATEPVISLFGLGPDAAEVIKAFTYVSAGGFIFAGALYVSNASFNNLGRPIYSTAFNWLKDGVLMWPLCILLSSYFAAPGVVYGQGLAWSIAGIAATIVGWQVIGSVEARDIAKAGLKTRLR